MKFQFTNSTYGSKNIFRESINEMLMIPDFKKDLLEKINITEKLKNNSKLIEMVQENNLNLDGVELLKNDLSLPVLVNNNVLGNQSGLNPREILQALGDELRGVNNNIFLAFLAKDILIELETRKERIELKSFMGGAGVGKDTLSEYYFDSISDTRTSSEIDFLIDFNSCIAYEDQVAYLRTFISKIELEYSPKEKHLTDFEEAIYKNIDKTIKQFNKEKGESVLEFNQDKKRKGLITFISRPILTEEEYRGEDYALYLDEQKKVYKHNGIEFTKRNQDIFGFIRAGVNVSHYTEKLNHVIRIFLNSKNKNAVEVKAELDYVLTLGSLSESQKSEFVLFFAKLRKNKDLLEVIENKHLEDTVDNMVRKMFKSAIINTSEKFKSTELVMDSLKDSPQKVVASTNIYFDFDDVIVNFIPEWIKWINERLGTNYAKEEIQEFWWFNKLGERLLEEGRSVGEVNEIVWDFLQSDVYQNVEKHNNMINIMRYLKGVGFNVKILSAGVSRSKEMFVEQHIDFLNAKKDMIITANKSIVQPGVLVDDGGHNTEEMVRDNNMTYCVLIDTPYNQHIETGKRITRVNIGETKNILDLIIAKAYSSEARKHNFSLILEDIGIKVTEEQSAILNGLLLEDVVNLLTTQSTISKKGKLQ